MTTIEDNLASLVTQGAPPATGATPVIFTSITSATMLAANPLAKRRVIRNIGPSQLCFVFGTANAATASSPYLLNPGDVWEDTPCCTDAIVGILLSTGSASIQEFT